jgi:PBSX family phage terminase large subunit
MTTPELIAVYKPLPWQLDPLNDKSPTLLLTGSAGGGKSRCAAEKVNAYCWHYPGSTWLICRKAREWNSHSIIPFMWKTVMGEDPRIRHTSSDGSFFYPNGSVIYSAGMYDDKQRQAARSIGGDGGLDGAWFEEANAFTRQDYEEIIGRVRHTAAHWQQIILTTNPDAPTHWIYKDLIQGGGASVYYSGAKDNPNNSPMYLTNLQKMTGVMKDRLVDGKWVQAEGAIYDEYDPAIHMIDADKCPPFVRRFRVVDFGYSNPFVCQWWGMDADGRLYRYREMYVTRKLVEELTPKIIRLTAGESIEMTVTDHDAEDRATMEKHGISTTTAIKDVSPGIQAVKARLKVQPDGKPRLYFVRGALVEVDPLLEADKKPTCTEDELPGYSWKKYDDGKPNKEEPVKLNDHGCDTTRYIVAKIDGTLDPSKMIDAV